MSTMIGGNGGYSSGLDLTGLTNQLFASASAAPSLNLSNVAGLGSNYIMTGAQQPYNSFGSQGFGAAAPFVSPMYSGVNNGQYNTAQYSVQSSYNGGQGMTFYGNGSSYSQPQFNYAPQQAPWAMQRVPSQYGPSRPPQFNMPQPQYNAPQQPYRTQANTKDTIATAIFAHLLTNALT